MITAIFRAPELSATSRIDCIWIIGLSSLDGPGPFDDARYRPPLPAADRASFHDRYNVTDLSVMLAIVGVIVLFTVWPMFSAWSAVRTFERTALDAGYVDAVSFSR